MGAGFNDDGESEALLQWAQDACEAHPELVEAFAAGDGSAAVAILTVAGKRGNWLAFEALLGELVKCIS